MGESSGEGHAASADCQERNLTLFLGGAMIADGTEKGQGNNDDLPYLLGAVQTRSFCLAKSGGALSQ